MRAYQDMVFTTAARITGNDAQAQDIAQEVFLKAYGQFDQLRTSATAGGWLKTVATRLALNHLSRYRKRWRFFSELQHEDATDEESGPQVEFPAADDVLAELEAQQRDALIERALQEQIARELGVSLAKVKTDIFRGRAALLRAMGTPT
jgi:RNA polymerase sigma-70 factor, ECF subfamily